MDIKIIFRIIISVLELLLGGMGEETAISRVSKNYGVDEDVIRKFFD